MPIPGVHDQHLRLTIQQAHWARGWLEQHGIPHELFLDRYPADLYAAYGSTRYLLHIHSDEHLAWYLMARP